MSQVGWASASSRVTPSRSVRPRKGPPLAVSTSRSTLPGRWPSSSWNSAECSESTGIRCAPVASASAMTSSPPTTRLSLLASARSMPSPRVATVGPKPGRADQRVEHQVAVGVGDQLHEPLRPGQHRPCSPARAAASGPRARCAPRRSGAPAPAAAPSWMRRPARPPRGRRLRWITSSAWVPIEPVDPTMTILRTRLSLGAGRRARPSSASTTRGSSCAAGHPAQLQLGLVRRASAGR